MEVIMSIDYMMEMKNYYKRTETESIHIEIFKDSSEYKYYLLGIAQGLYTIYNAMSVPFAKEVHTEDWREFIRKMAEDDSQVNKYFNRLIDAI
jgi:hypothetical protein